MHMLYNSDHFAVVRFDIAAPQAPQPDGAAPQADAPALTRGGYEIVDKLSRKEIYLEGALAETFQKGVQALVDKGPTEEALDDYIGRFTALAQQPVVLH